MLDMAIGIVNGGAKFTDLLMVRQAGDPATPYAMLAAAEASEVPPERPAADPVAGRRLAVSSGR